MEGFVMKTTAIKYLLIFNFVLCSTAYAASFDCTKATSDVERMVCSDHKLNRLDDFLSQNFNIAMNSEMPESVKSDIRKTQGEWIERRDSCTDEQCVKNMYSRRIDYLWNKCFENIKGRINYVKYSEALEIIEKENSNASSKNLIASFLAKHESQIHDLGFTDQQLNSSVFIELGAYTRYSTLKEYLSLMYELPNFKSLDKINYKDYVGFRIKLSGQPYSGFVLRDESHELYLKGIVSGDEVIEAETAQDNRKLSSIFMTYASYVLNKDKFKP